MHGETKIAIFILIIIVLLFATNPTKPRFVEFAKNEMIDELENQGVDSNNAIENFISQLVGEATKAAADITYTRDEYYLFSIYEIKGINFGHTYLGVFNNFIDLGSNEPSENTNYSQNSKSDQVNTSTEPKVINVSNKKDSVKEDYYSFMKVDLPDSRKLNIKMELISGPEIEVYVLDPINFRKFENNNDDVKVYGQYEVIFHLDETLSLPPDTYYIVIDNTDDGSVIPPMNLEDDIARFKFEVNLVK